MRNNTLQGTVVGLTSRIILLLYAVNTKQQMHTIMYIGNILSSRCASIVHLPECQPLQQSREEAIPLRREGPLTEGGVGCAYLVVL